MTTHLGVSWQLLNLYSHSLHGIGSDSSGDIIEESPDLTHKSCLEHVIDFILLTSCSNGSKVFQLAFFKIYFILEDLCTVYMISIKIILVA